MDSPPFVLTKTKPSGRVLIGNAPYPARAVGKSIEAASEVTVIGGDRFCLLVQAVDATQPVTSLPGFGEEVLVGKELALAESAQAAAALKRAREEHARAIFGKAQVPLVADHEFLAEARHIHRCQHRRRG